MTLSGYIMLSALCFSSPSQNDSLSIENYTITNILEVESSVRSIDVRGDSTIAFAGSGGLIGLSLDAGATWDTTRIYHNGNAPSFRSCAITGESIIFATIESPGIIYKTSFEDIRDAKIEYYNDSEGMFLDAIAVSDDGLAVSMGDPVDGCLTILISENSGDSWRRVPCHALPEIIEGEAAFAASNGNISIFGNSIRIATGGMASRVFSSDDRGRTWSATPTPLLQGSQMTGAFAVAFSPDSTGILIGGNWEEKLNNYGNIATSIDAGSTWTLTSEGWGPGYRSCVTWNPAHPGQCIATGSEGIDISYDSGNTWLPIRSQGLYTARFTPDGATLWMAGHKQITKLHFNENPDR